MKWMRFQILWIAFVMLVMGFVFWRVSLGWRVNQQLAAIRAAGQPTTWSELSKWYGAVPDSENAALVLTQAFALCRTFPDRRSNKVANVELPPCGHPLPPEVRQLVIDYLDLNREALARMREALKLPKCRYPITFLSIEDDLPHLAKLKGLALYCRFEAIVAMDSGQTANAAAAIEDMLKLAGTLDEEPVLISQLVRTAIISIAAGTLERCLSTAEFRPQDLETLASAFTAAEKPRSVARGLIGERVRDIAMFQVDWSGITKSERAALRVAHLSGYFERGLPRYLQTMATNISLAAKGPPEWLTAVKVSERLRDEAPEHEDDFSWLFADTGHYFNRITEGFARIRLASAALAVERFRSPNEVPVNLDQLTPKFLATAPVDPFDGARLRYRRLAKGYLIYSIGRDLHDDGGREIPRASTNAMIYAMTATNGFRRRYGLDSGGAPSAPAPAPAAGRSSNTINSLSWRPNRTGTSSTTNAPARVTYDLTFTVER